MDVRDIDGKKCQTEVKKKTLNPRWDQSFVFQVPNIQRWAVRLQLWDWDLTGQDKLGYVDVLGSSKSEQAISMPLVEGGGVLHLGWAVSKEYRPDDVGTNELRVTMPAERPGRLKVQVKNGSEFEKPLNACVRLIDGATGASQTTTIPMTSEPHWNQWLAIDVPDLASWTLQLELMDMPEQADAEALGEPIGSVSLQADKFNIGGLAADTKTLPLTGGKGELTVAVKAAKGCQRLAAQVQRAKDAMVAEQIRRARLQQKTLVDVLSRDGKYAGDIQVRLVDLQGLLHSSELPTVYASVEGLLTPAREEVTTKPLRFEDASWDEVFFLHVPDLANFSFNILLWEGSSKKLLGKLLFQKEVCVGRCNIGSLDVDLTQTGEVAPLELSVGEKGKLRVVVSGTPGTVDVAKRLAEEAAAAAAGPIAWPDERRGMLRLHVIRANDLTAADIGGTSDPYVRISGVFDAHGKEVRTATIKKTVNPYWNEWFDIPMPDMASFDLTLGIWDFDIGADDTIGYVSVKSEEWTVVDEEVRKTLNVNNGSGTIEIGIAPTLHSRALMRQIKAAKAAGLAPISITGASKLLRAKYSGVVRVTFIEAHALKAADRGGTSDPYCMIPKSFFCDTRGAVIKTKVVKKTLDPEWKESFEIWIPDLRRFEFQVTVWDWDLTTHDPLGYVNVLSTDFSDFYLTVSKGFVFAMQRFCFEHIIFLSSTTGLSRQVDGFGGG